MEIQLANPDLRAVHGTNLDLGVAWQGPGGLHLALSGFAKRLARYLNDTGNDLNNPDAVMQYRAVRLIRPENGGTATIVGLEASAAVPLGGVARVLRHVALAGDLTMLHSAVRLNNPALDRVERTQYAPASNLLLRLHYDDGRISADAACRLTGAYIQEYGIEVPTFAGTTPLSGSALDTWVRPSRQIDLAVARQWGTHTAPRAAQCAQRHRLSRHDRPHERCRAADHLGRAASAVDLDGGILNAALNRAIFPIKKKIIGPVRGTTSGDGWLQDQAGSARPRSNLLARWEFDT
jgi:hypothetical protein